MNITELFHDVKLSLGLNTISLPFKEPLEVVMQEVLTTTIREFSQFEPYVREATCVPISQLRYRNDERKQQGIYYLPETLTITPVYDASAEIAGTFNPYSNVSNSVFTAASPFVGFGSYFPQDIVNATMTAAAINKYNGLTTKTPTSKYIGFNEIQLVDFPVGSLANFKVKCCHDLSGETIDNGFYLSFRELFEINIKRTFYNQLKNIVNTGTVMKENQLKIDDWSSAEGDHASLIEKWTESFYVDDVEDLVMFF